MTDITLDKEKIPKKMANLSVFANLGSALGPIIAGFIVLITWRLLYILYAVMVAVYICVIKFIPKPSLKVNKDSKIASVFADISKEIRRSIVILLVVSGFLFSLSYQTVLIWTITEITGTVTETVMGVIFCILGIVGAINGTVIGKIIEKKGIKIVLIYGISALFLTTILLFLLGDITRSEVIIYAIIVITISGVVGSTLFIIFSYLSQILSEKRRGTLAGLSTASIFIGFSLIPIIFTPIYENSGIAGVYLTSMILSVGFVGSTILLYLRAKKYNLNKDLKNNNGLFTSAP